MYRLKLRIRPALSDKTAKRRAGLARPAAGTLLYLHF
jgi:hypothetical protein